MEINNKYHITSLGCAKNSVDSASMGQLLNQAGYRRVSNPARANILIVNTCGFIAPASEESYLTLQSIAKSKKTGQILIAAGCLTQRYGAEVIDQIPQVDGILGTRRWMDIIAVVRKIQSQAAPLPIIHFPVSPRIGNDPLLQNGTPATIRACQIGASAYLKIADGCSRKCAFCAIPQIKGPMISRRPQAILHDAFSLRDSGIRELVLIAQDTTTYGSDLGEKDGLTSLLKVLIKEVRGVDWIRIMYAFPGFVSDELIDLMVEQPQILPYLDMPLQHAHPATLRRMKRPDDMHWVYKIIEKLRKRLPDIAIRTSFIVGYPGETKEEFNHLLDFIKEIRFDHIGAFPFSFESGTPSEALGDPIPQEVKEIRYQLVMELQQKISLEIHRSWIGQITNVLIEGKDRGFSIGRSYRDAPEVDGTVIVDGSIPTGSLIPVRITGAAEYDLSGTPA